MKFLFLSLMIVLSNCVVAQEPIVIKFSHVVAANTPKGKAAAHFQELVQQRLAGRVRVDIFPNSILYNQDAEFAALQNGDVQMLAPSLSEMYKAGVPAFEIFDLPYIFSNQAMVHSVFDGEIGQNLLKKLEPKGVKGLAYWDSGFRQISSNRPLHLPEDFKGFKIRTDSSPVLQASMKALGAEPIYIAFNVTYNALKSGEIDGQDNTVSNFLTQRMNEVQKYLTISNHSYLAYAVLVNKKFWDELPEDIRKVLTEAISETTLYERKIAESMNAEALSSLKLLKTTNVYELTPKEIEAWKNVLVPIYSQFESEIGTDNFSAINSLAKKTNGT